MKSMIIAFLLPLVLVIMACERIQEPWLSHPGQLESERARPFEAKQALQHRLLNVQSDR